MIVTTLLLLSLVQTAPVDVVGSELRPLNATADLRGDISGVDGPAWVGYAVPLLAGAHSNCGGVFDLERGGNVTSDETPDDESGELYVFFRVVSGKITELRSVASGCRVRTGAGPVYWLASVPSERSLGLLEDVMRREPNSELAESAVHAIARHASPAADVRLSAFARGELPLPLREKTVFWMGAARGESGFQTLQTLIDEVSERALREKIVFALHVSDVSRATSTLVRIARDDRDPEIREKALFWLAQEAGNQASAAIVSAVRSDPDLEVKNKAVFALSQLPADEGVPLLVEIAQSHPQMEIRKKAFFWLGQSGDPQALALIEQVLTRNP